MPTQPKRPVFFQLLQLHLPLTALVSIAHRVTALLLFFALAPAIWLLELSLTDAAGFAHAQQLIHGWPQRLLGALLLWALFHHLLAGLRLLLIDAEIGVERRVAQRTAGLVTVLGFIALLVGVWWL